MLSTLLPEGVAVAEIGPREPAPLHPGDEPTIAAAGAARRREFAAGRDCARRALERLGCRAAVLPIGPERAPVWPDGYVGSITHCAGYACAAVAPERRLVAVGIDAERREAVPAAVAELVATPAELRAASVRLPALGPSLAATLLFSMKESVYKCWQPLTGEHLEFTDVRIDILGPDSFRAAVAAVVDRERCRTGSPAPPGRGRPVGLTGRFAADDERFYTAVFIATPGRPHTARRSHSNGDCYGI